MGLTAKVIYVKGDQNTEVQSEKVSLGDIFEIACSDTHVLAKVKALRIAHFRETGPQRMVISIVKVVETIQTEYPEIEVINLGAPDLIITYEKEKQKVQLLEKMKVGLVCVITFVGAAFSIMTFNNDVGISKLFAQIYELTTGEIKRGLTLLEISYSVGIAIGIIVFFNHFGKRKFSVDPTPIEVEMRTYENEIQTTLIQNYEREEGE